MALVNRTPLKGLAAASGAVATAVLAPLSASALSLMDVINGDYRGQGQPTELFDGGAAIIPRLINLMLFIVGILAVIMLIWGGIKYATSAGDSNKVTAAKNTILYAVIGLAVAVLAFAIVNFVVSNLTDGTLTGPKD